MNTNPQPVVSAGLLVIGDEILSGRTPDRNINTIARFCTELGIDLSQVRVVADDVDEVVEAVNALRTRYTHVFTTGGIGPTHDDITAQCMATAFGVELVENPEAIAMMEHRFGDSRALTAARRRMARIPAGATLIPNIVSAAPGFKIGNVYVMAGVPKIMQAMLENIAPTLEGGRRLFSRTIEVGVGESAIAGALKKIQDEYDDVKIGSYPRMGEKPVFTEVVLRGADELRLDEAAQKVHRAVNKAHAEHGVNLG
ncbi:MAG TPA: competence/damage-inducible protein A [Devosia sp.]|nr:competence/damage-inducible protein A [Devosia sp.]